MAGYKGAGLALMFGLLAGTLNGALFGRDCHRLQRASPTPSPIPASSWWRSTRRASSRSSSSRPRSTAICRELRASAALPGESVRLPGEQRAQRRADRLANGLALPAELHVELDKMAAELAIKPLAAR